MINAPIVTYQVQANLNSINSINCFFNHSYKLSNSTEVLSLVETKTIKGILELVDSISETSNIRPSNKI